jgi:hypothetical protein
MGYSNAARSSDGLSLWREVRPTSSPARAPLSGGIALPTTPRSFADDREVCHLTRPRRAGLDTWHMVVGRQKLVLAVLVGASLLA